MSFNREATKEMYHDFSTCITAIQRGFSTPETIEHIERCIGTLHEYLKYGNITKFYTYYTGDNIPDGMN